MIKETSSGAVIYRYHNNKREFLIVQNANGHHYGFPKGHIEIHETLKKTALREVKEETNIDAHIISNHKSFVSYSPKEGYYKRVYYFIAKPLTFDFIKQDSEILNILWLDEQKVHEYLTFDNDNKVFNKLLKIVNSLEEGVNPLIIDYVENKILPIYNTFDTAHHSNHIYDVIYESLALSKNRHISKNMVYVTAAFHDLGLQFGRETHHITSGNLLKEDEYISSFFTNDEMALMIEAIFDHRASNAHEPRSIYGKILAEADRQLNPREIIYRTALYETYHNPRLTREEHLNNCLKHLDEKYSDNGYLKLWLNDSKNAKGLKTLRSYINDREKIKKLIMGYLRKI